MQIIHYPHPTLRHESRPVKRVDAELRRMIGEMFDLMHAAHGIGLAANQVDLPYRLFVLNLTADPAAVDEQLVFINPVITNRKGLAEAEEGCLSIPGVYANVRRPEKIRITAFNFKGEEVTYEVGGLFARAAQHELDHLDGVLFIDRLTNPDDLKLREKLTQFEQRFHEARTKGEILSDEEIAQRLGELEGLRT